MLVNEVSAARRCYTPEESEKQKPGSLRVLRGRLATARRFSLQALLVGRLLGCLLCSLSSMYVLRMEPSSGRRRHRQQNVTDRDGAETIEPGYSFSINPTDSERT